MSEQDDGAAHAVQDGPRGRIELVVLDMAGTTVADDGLVQEAFTRAWQLLHGPERLEAARAHVAATMGQSKVEVFRRLLDTEQEAQELNEGFEAAYEALVREGRITAIEGAVQAIVALRQAGRQVLLTTGFSRRTAEGVLASIVWQDGAPLLLTPADAGRGRPAPDLNLTAAIRTGVSGVGAMAVVGDTPSDMLSGVRAGAGLVVGVLTGASDEAQLRDAGAHLVLASVADLPALLERLGR